MPYVSSGAKNYFKVTGRQYDVLLIDPRGVFPISRPHSDQLDRLVTTYDLWIHLGELRCLLECLTIFLYRTTITGKPAQDGQFNGERGDVCCSGRRLLRRV